MPSIFLEMPVDHQLSLDTLESNESAKARIARFSSSSSASLPAIVVVVVVTVVDEARLHPQKYFVVSFSSPVKDTRKRRIVEAQGL